LSLPIPPAVKKKLKNAVFSSRDAYLRWRHAFGPEDILTGLRRLGVQEGDTLFVHASHAEFVAYRGKPDDIIGVLQRAVGSAGTLLMPTLSFSGVAVDHAKRKVVFDPARTPSHTGLLTELFRRSPGVIRSVHPTHSVAAWGRLAHEFIRDHHLAATPCGIGSPYHRLLQHKGQVLLLGVGIAAFTFYHTIEEMLEARMPKSPFTAETYSLACRVDGRTFEAGPMRLFEPEVSRRRTLAPLETELKRRGQWRQVRIGTLSMILLDPLEALTAADKMASGNVFCYREV
jgi:aminoglycoside 3-N-acetyltransferase